MAAAKVKEPDEWVKVNTQGEFVKWQENGQSIEGIWNGSAPGQYENQVGTITTKDGVAKKFSMTSTLVTAFQAVQVGASVKVVYTGFAKNQKSGREYKTFDVFTKPAVNGDKAPF